MDKIKRISYIQTLSLICLAFNKSWLASICSLKFMWKTLSQLFDYEEELVKYVAMIE